MSRHSTVSVRTGPYQPSRQVLERWESLMCETYIPLAVTPHTSERFGGRIAATEFDGLLVTSVQAAAQTVRRTPRLIGTATDRYILASIYAGGRGIMHQDGRSAHVEAGSMVFYDSARPYVWEIDEEFDKVVVQVPIAALEAVGAPVGRIPSAIALGPDHPAAAVGAYFRGLARVQRTDPEVAEELATHGVGMMASALSLAAGSLPRGTGADDLTRARIIAFMRRRFADADLTVDAVAHRFAISRRTLYRLFEGEESPARRLLTMRLEHACHLLRDGGMRIEEVAAAAGFTAERQFYRVFRAEFGMAPGEFRAG
ncbi:AraC family transcriptional regulator [Nocardia asteroides]|uniref:AraC family transcriptional regulator n=1 Tax=Nocardia asteroides TaxID=1824 RepID=UPI001E5138AF|nr:AraC family transcriptional regulator [Nocardia asteroides]UGT53514.1 AraC family transcriptional regulator [Nocardia asteroides]